MNASPLALLLAVLLPLLLGVGVLRALGIRWRTEPLAYLGWAWLAGSLGTGAVVWLWLWTNPGRGASPWLPNLVLAGLGLGLLLAGRRRPACPAESDASPVPSAERWFFGSLVAVVLGVNLANALQALGTGIVDGDEANLWVQRAKILFEAGGFNQTFRELLAPPLFNTPHQDYPLLSVLLHLWTFLQAGHITHVANRLPFQCLALAEVLIVAASLRRASRPWVAALLLVVLASLWRSLAKTHGGYADLLVSLGAVAAVDAWLRWQRTGQRAWLGMAAIGLSCCVATKNEGLLFLACVVGAALVMLLARPGAWRQPRVLWPLACLVPPLVVVAAGWQLNRTFGFESVVVRESLIGTLFQQLLVNVWPVLAYYTRTIWLGPEHSSCFFPTQILLMLMFPLAVWRSALLLPGLALVAALAGFVAIHIATPPAIGLDWHLTTTAPRVVFQIVPGVVVWIGAAAGTLLGLRAGAHDDARQLAA